MLQLVRAALTSADASADAHRARHSFRAADPDADHPDFQYYRKVGGAKRDLPQRTDADIRERALGFRRNNPLVNRFLSLMRQYILQSPFTVTATAEDEAEREAVQEVLDEFWTGAYNSWQAMLPSYLDILSCSGVLALPVMVNRVDGSVRVGYADPEEIAKVIPLPENSRILDRIFWRPGRTAIELPIVRANIDRMDEWHGRLMGVHPKRLKSTGITGMLYFRLNPLANESTGLSDISASVDHIDAHEDYMAGQLEAARVLGRTILDVTVTGDEAEVADALERYKDFPAWAAVTVHNETETHVHGMAASQGADAAERDRMHGNYATAPLGPPYILRGDMGEGNRAIATQANDPMHMLLQERANFLIYIATFACQFALDQAVIVGRLKPGQVSVMGQKPAAFTVRGPKILKKDLAAGVVTLNTAAQALTLAESQGYVDNETATDVFLGILPELGRDDIDIKEVKSKLEEAEAQRVPGPDERPEEADALKRALDGEPALDNRESEVAVTEATVLNGAQITAASAIVQAVADGTLPRDSGLGQLEVFFNLSRQQAESIMGSVGKGFTQKVEEVT